MYMTCTEGGSNKFYELTRDGLTVEARYGKVDSEGVRSVKTFDTTEKTMAYFEKQIEEKVKKGYVIQEDFSEGDDDDDEG